MRLEIEYRYSRSNIECIIYLKWGLRILDSSHLNAKLVKVPNKKNELKVICILDEEFYLLLACLLLIKFKLRHCLCVSEMGSFISLNNNNYLFRVIKWNQFRTQSPWTMDVLQFQVCVLSKFCHSIHFDY